MDRVTSVGHSTKGGEADDANPAAALLVFGNTEMAKN